MSTKLVPGIVVTSITRRSGVTLVSKRFLPCLREVATAELFLHLLLVGREEFTNLVMETWDETNGPFGSSCVVIDGPWTVIFEWVPEYCLDGNDVQLDSDQNHD